MKIQSNINKQILFANSSLITTDAEVEIIKSFLNVKQIKLNLIFKATLDGFEVNSYRTKVLNKKNLLTIIKSEYFKVFGFYTSV